MFRGYYAGIHVTVKCGGRRREGPWWKSTRPLLICVAFVDVGREVWQIPLFLVAAVGEPGAFAAYLLFGLDGQLGYEFKDFVFGVARLVLQSQIIG